METEKRGSIAFFSTYRPPVPLDIFSCPLAPTSSPDDELEHRMTDGKSYNYSGQDIPPAALIKIFNHTSLAFRRNQDDVNSGRVSGMVFVSEREDLELLHIALRFKDVNPPRLEVYSLADVFPRSPCPFNGVRMEDSGCFTHDHLIFVSTKEPATERRQPWTAVYKTNLKTGKTDRLTPGEHADLSPSVSPSGKKIAVASFEGKKGGWAGEIEDLRTNIYVMNVEEPYNRTKVVENGGWPTWGSDDVIFFHRKDDHKHTTTEDSKVINFWGVYRADISSGVVMRVTPDSFDAFTPAAINATTVAVATIRQNSKFSDVREEAQYRHIEIFSSEGGQEPKQITQKTRPMADHFNPFVIGGGKRIGYHRCTSDVLDNEEEIKRQFQTVISPDRNIGLFRVGGGFPTFSQDGSKLAFVDNDFKIVYVLDNERLYEANELTPNSIFSPVWNQCDKKDTLYVCIGPSFSADETVDIHAIRNVSRGRRQTQPLTDGFNNAFPSTNPEGTRLVFRSTKDGYKNLYIMENAEEGALDGAEVTRLTDGNWTDTQCQWSPSGNWIVFSSNRDKPEGAPEKDHGLDSGYFAIYLVNPDDPDHVCIRVITSGNDIGGHVNHPFFSPDGLSIVVTSDLAGVSVDPISLPIFVHSARPYGDIFTIDIDLDDINKTVKTFNRITHSRYENSTGTWTRFSTMQNRAARNLLKHKEFTKACPCPHLGGNESWHMTGHLVVPKGCS
ncbi:uncharacterized protein LOC126794967 [Argentina anserina]|uniref:uncharacterized protein LOC126794967 n=1 Tax=Argentina anserina TaxID=57926 RepID=UPI0021765441|nr:uncharacterized protein LOC126794967 [Potentilla anserina]